MKGVKNITNIAAKQVLFDDVSQQKKKHQQLCAVWRKFLTREGS